MGKTSDTSFALSRKDTGILDGTRNKIINGNFDIWQRGTTQSASGYGSDDRWLNNVQGNTFTNSRVTFTPGQTEVPGNPIYFSRTVVNSVAGAGNYVVKTQRVENVALLAGKTITLTFYAKADSPKNIAIEFYQFFGTGGTATPSSTPVGLIALTTAWKRYDVVVTVPTLVGKTLGTSHHTEINFWMNGGTTFASRSSNLGQQSGTFDFAHVSLVEGDARSETDPFAPRLYQQELYLCYYYYQVVNFSARWNAAGASNIMDVAGTWLPMRQTPTSASLGLASSNNLQSYSLVVVNLTGGRFEIISSTIGDCYAIAAYYGLDAEL